MIRTTPTLLAALALLAPAARAQDEAKPASFLGDVAPIFVENCIACHNGRKSESKYNMVTFATLAKGGANGEGITLIPGDAEGSYLVELLAHDAQPRMPYKLDPLPQEKIDLIARWVKEGATYDGDDPAEDWTAVLNRRAVAVVPESYPATVPITAVAFSPDAAHVATSGYHEVNLWKVADGTLVRRLRGVGERVHDIAYSPDGKWLAVAGGDPGRYGKATLWLAEPDGGGKPVRTLAESTDAIYAVAFSPDGKLVACAGADRAIRIFHVETGAPHATIEDHADWIFDLAFSPDGKRLASASRDKTSKVFDVEKKESLVTFPGHAETVYAVTFLPDGKTVVSAGGDNQLRWWSPDEDGKQLRNVGGFGGAIFQLKLTPDGQRLIATSADKGVHILQAAEGKDRNKLDGHADWVYALAVAPDGARLASGAWDGNVILWNLAEGKPERTILAAPGYTPTTTTAAQ
jgi:WD40 repeat protein